MPAAKPKPYEFKPFEPPQSASKDHKRNYLAFGTLILRPEVTPSVRVQISIDTIYPEQSSAMVQVWRPEGWQLVAHLIASEASQMRDPEKIADRLLTLASQILSSV